MYHIMIVGTNMMNIYNHRLELIKKLLKEGFFVSVVAPHGGEEQKLIDIGVNFIDIPIDNRGTNPINDLKLLFNLAKIFNNKSPDIVLTFYTKTNIYAGLACRMTNTPYIENITGLGTAIINGGFMQKFMLRLYKLAVGKASMIFYQNTHDRNVFKHHNIRPEIGRLLPGSGVSLDRFQVIPYPSDEKIEFVFISRVIKEKGISEYIETAHAVKSHHKNVCFHVVGPCDDSCKNMIDNAVKKGDIVFHSKVYDVHPILSRTHCTIFPSYYGEGMANVLLESSASGRPIITTNVPGCGESLEDGVTGFVVKPKNTADLISKVETFINLPYNEKKEMGLNGRKKMEKEFNREIVTNAYLDEIHKILSC